MIRKIVNNYQMFKYVGKIGIYRIFGTLLGFLSTVLITRYLGINSSGIYYTYISIIEFCVAFFGMGLTNTLLRHTAQSKSGEDNKELIVYLESILLTLVGIILGVILNELIPGGLHQFINVIDFSDYKELVYVLIIILSITRLTTSFMQGQAKIIPFVFFSGTLTPFLVLLFTLIFSPNEFDYSLYIYASAISITFIFSMIFVLITNNLTWKFEFNKRSFRGAYSFWVTNMMTILTTSGMIIIISNYLEPSDIAIISVSNRIVILLTFLMSTISIIYAPKLALLHSQGDINGVKNLYVKSTKLLWSISFPIFVLIILFHKSILNIFGDGFSEGNNVFLVIVFANFINVSFGLVWTILNMTGHEKTVKKVVVFFSIISVALLPFMSSEYGSIGAASIIFFFTTSTNFVLFLFVNKQYSFIFKRERNV